MNISLGSRPSLVLLCCLFVASCNSPPATLPNNSALGQEADRASVQRGYYVSDEGPDVLGYRDPNRHDHPPICKLRGPYDANDVGIDFEGDVMVPDSGNGSIDVYRGPRMCGRWIGSFRDPYGNPVDAASADATDEPIIVADSGDGRAVRGSILRCTLAKGCDTRLTNRQMAAVFSVALARDGDCWALGAGKRLVARLNLTYFKHCRGGGQSALGFTAKFTGNLDIDSAGNIVTVFRCCTFLHPKTAVVSIYKGCNPRCKRVGGPFSTGRGPAYCGHLNEDSTKLALANLSSPEVDIFRYSTTAVTFLYSFATPPGNSLNCVAVLPRSSE